MFNPKYVFFRRGRICLLNDIDGNTNFEENAFKLRLFLMSLPLLVFLAIWHFRTKVSSPKKFSSVKDSCIYLQVRRFICSYCPLGKMSCIGRYRRNVLTLKQTMAWVLLWCLSGVADIGLETIFIRYKEEWSRDTLFWIWNIKGFLANEGFHMLIPLALSIPSEHASDNLDNVDFYVRKPLVLIPRRPNNQTTCELTKPSYVQHFMYIKRKAPEKKQEKLEPKTGVKVTKEHAKVEIPWPESNSSGIVLSIPNLLLQKEVLSILYCKVHQSKHLSSCSALQQGPPSLKDERSEPSLRQSPEVNFVKSQSDKICTQSSGIQPPLCKTLFSSSEEFYVHFLSHHSGQAESFSWSDPTLPDIHGRAKSALHYSRFTHPDISYPKIAKAPCRRYYNSKCY